MIYTNKKNKIIDTTLNSLSFFPNNLNKILINNNLTINHLKINNDSTNDILNDASSIYSLLESWEDQTMLNAFFNNDLEAGNIKGSGENISKLIIKRLSPETNYINYEILGEIPYDKTKKIFTYKDYFIISDQVYLYTVQPVTELNHYGALQNDQPGLNRYEYSWFIDTTGEQIEILNSTISSININTKDGIIETIGGEKPFVNRFSNLNYKTFQINGTIASIGDFNNHLIPDVEENIYTNRKDIQEIINKKFLERTGSLPNVISNSMRNDLNFERKFRNKVEEILKNGNSKIFKSPTEGLMIIKLTNISLTPKTSLNRIIYDFSATATEVDTFSIDSIKDFNIKDVIEIE